jgi:hypothetical protein
VTVGNSSLIAPTYREREKFCRLRPDTVKARLMRDTLQRPGNGTVSPLVRRMPVKRCRQTPELADSAAVAEL